jgi:hypothetical protein
VPRLQLKLLQFFIPRNLPLSIESLFSLPLEVHLDLWTTWPKHSYIFSILLGSIFLDAEEIGPLPGD